MLAITIYTTSYCPYCVRAKQLLAHKKLDFVEVDVSHDDARRAWLVETTGLRTVPQVFVGDRSVGGFDDLAALERAGELDKLLAGNP